MDYNALTRHSNSQEDALLRFGERQVHCAGRLQSSCSVIIAFGCDKRRLSAVHADRRLWLTTEVHRGTSIKEEEGRLARKEISTKEGQSWEIIFRILKQAMKRMITRISNWSPK